jgi:hypothetical protein
MKISAIRVLIAYDQNVRDDRSLHILFLLRKVDFAGLNLGSVGTVFRSVTNRGIKVNNRLISIVQGFDFWVMFFVAH